MPQPRQQDKPKQHSPKGNRPLPGFPPKIPRPPKKGWMNNLASTVLVILILVSLYSLFFSGTVKSENIPLSQLAGDIESGMVTTVVVEGNKLTIGYKDGGEKKAQKESDAALYTSLSNYGVSPEALAKVSVEVKDESGFRFWFFSLAPILLPLLLIGIFVWFLSRQVKGTGMQAFTFGQSKARMIDPRDISQRVTFSDVAGAKEAKEELAEIVDFLKNPKKFLDIGARIPKGVLLMGAPGTGKCVVGNTLVLTGKGLMEIQDVATYYAVNEAHEVFGATLPAVNVKETKSVKAAASHWYDLGEQETRRVSLQDGLELEGTPEHPVLVMSKFGALLFKRLDELTGEDAVAISFNNHVYGNCRTVDEKTAYMMGLLTGDGNMSHASRIGFTTTDKELEKMFTSFVKTYDDSCVITRATDGITQTVSSWKIKRHLYQAGMSYLLSYDKVIPPSILQAPKDVLVHFLRGLFDSDGSFEQYTVTYSTVSKKLSDQVMAALLNLGMTPKRRIKMSVDTAHLRPVYEVSIGGTSLPVFQNEIGFGLKRKQDKLEHYVNTHRVGNTNVDVFPNISEKVDACWQVLSASGKSSEGLSKLISHVRARKRISRASLTTFVQTFEQSGCMHPDFPYLKKLLEANLIFSPVARIQKGREHVYDFTVPIFHSFISNGFVSHNTLLGRAVAGEAGVPFFSISGSEFVEMFVGVGASRVRDLFNMAKNAAPAIIFVDEIDAVGRVRGTGVGGGNDEREQTLNQILVEMDGFEPNEKVIIMAATNRPDVLDPALLRPGRFDRRVVIDLPDRNDREDILKIHARKKPLAEDVNLTTVAERTPGFSGADLYSLMNEGAILAARENRKKVSQFDLVRSIEKVMLGPERKSHLLNKKEKEITAYHEAGHALVASVLPYADPVHKISVISRGRAAGYTLKLPLEDNKMQSKKEFLDDIAVSLGGYVAEKEIFGDLTTGPSNDLQVSSALARDMVTKYGMSDTVGPIALEGEGGKALFGRGITEKEYSEVVSAKIDAEVKKIIDGAYKKAHIAIVKHRALLDAIAAKLMEAETIERDAFETILIAHGITPKKKQDIEHQA